MKGMKGKSRFSAPGDYLHFKSVVPLHQIPVSSKQWRYYDFGPKVVPPLICIPGTAGSADVYYKQVMALSMKGYRVISVDIPRVWNHPEWVHTFEKFLDAINVHHIHIYGTSLGGFLAQLFAQHRPRRVKSLVLSNTFLDTHFFAAAAPWAPVVSWTPSFLLKRLVLTGIPDGPHEPFISDSVDFVVFQVEALSKDDLASRLTLTVDSASVAPLLLPDASITIMDTHDYCAIPQTLKDEVGERYPGARRADLKSGGDFPFLSRPDEVNLHLQLHLRRVGVAPRLDLVPGAPRILDVGNSHQENERAYNNHRLKYDASSSRAPSVSELSYDDVDIDGSLKNDEDNSGGLSKSDEQEVTDLIIADESSSCRGPLRGIEREDKDDPPGDIGGSYRDPLNSIAKDNTGDQALGHSESSGQSNNGESRDANDSPKDSEGVRSVEGTTSTTSNKQHPGNEIKSQTPLLNQDMQNVTIAGIYSEFVSEILLYYMLPAYMGALYITRSVFSCYFRQLGSMI